MAAPLAREARLLLRAARAGTLATVTDGQPFASLVTPATAPDLSPLLFLSSLSEHTRHLRADPRCALMVAGSPADANPQTAPRLTVTGIAEPVADAALKARWLAVHPYAAMYAGFADFSLWRIRIMAGQYVGGFARALRLKAAALSPDPTAVAVIEAAAPSIIEHCNTVHAEAMDLLGGPTAGGWRMVTIDVDGFDLALGERVHRIAFADPVSDGDGVRAGLIRLAMAARAAQAGPPGGHALKEAPNDGQPKEPGP